MYDRRLKEHGCNLALLQESYPGLVAAPVPARVGLAEAQAAGQTVWEYGGEGVEAVRQAYAALLSWLVVTPLPTPDAEGG